MQYREKVGFPEFWNILNIGIIFSARILEYNENSEIFLDKNVAK